MIGWDLQAIFSHASTQKCRFMGKEVHEISRFFVASPHELALSFWRISRTSLPKQYCITDLTFTVFQETTIPAVKCQCLIAVSQMS